MPRPLQALGSLTSFAARMRTDPNCVYSFDGLLSACEDAHADPYSKTLLFSPLPAAQPLCGAYPINWPLPSGGKVDNWKVSFDVDTMEGLVVLPHFFSNFARHFTATNQPRYVLNN
jgi:hypothetical protein